MIAVRTNTVREISMVTHIVLWKLADENTKDEHIQRMTELLEGLVGIVPGLREAHVHRGFNGFDAALVCTLESRDALDVYQNHSAHLQVKHYIHSIISERASCDFEN